MIRADPSRRAARRCSPYFLEGCFFPLVLAIAILGSGGVLYAASEHPAGDFPQAEVMRAHPLVKKYGCLTCHTIGDQGGTVGPVLNQAGARRGREWLLTWIKNPKAIRPSTPMPTFPMSQTERESLVKTIMAMAHPVDTREILHSSATPVEKGRGVFEAHDCYACHRVGRIGRQVGPDLTWIGFRKSRSWEKTWLRDPSSWKHGTFMPTFHLSEEEIEVLTAFLEQQRGEKHVEGRDWLNFYLFPTPVARGERIFRRFGCNGCHGEQGQGGNPNPGALGGKIPALAATAASYNKKELEERIRKGSTPTVEAQKKPTFAMPAWEDRISPAEMSDLVQFIFTIGAKKSKEEEW